jgi:uncharacterized SAM-binding protein YcdF (DUF218 family)
MFFFSKLATFFLLPPGVFFLAFLLAILLLYFGIRRAGALVACASLILFYALSTPAFSDLLIRPLEDRYPPNRLTATGAGDLKDSLVVVLDAGNVDRSPEEALRSSLGDESIKRLVYGLRIAKTLSLPLVFSGGQPYPKRGVEIESAAARRFIAESGFQGKSYFDDESRTTRESAKNVARLYRPASVILVTSAYHMPRSVASFEKAGLKVLPAPTDYKAARNRYSPVDFLPSPGAFGDSYRALHEYLGLVGYALAR